MLTLRRRLLFVALVVVASFSVAFAQAEKVYVTKTGAKYSPGIVQFALQVQDRDAPRAGRGELRRVQKLQPARSGCGSSYCKSDEPGSR